MTGTRGGLSRPFAWSSVARAPLPAAALLLIALALALEACSTPNVERRTPAPETTEASTPGALPPRLVRDTSLRATPQDGAREVARALAETPVRVAGRLEDGSWYVVEVVGRLDALGWVRRADLSPADPSSVPVVAPPGVVAPGAPGVGPTGVSNQPRDLPNLVLDGAYVRQNRLMVALSNDGYTDLAGPFTVTVNNGPPHGIELPGKPLRPGDRIDNVLEGEFVQRRATVRVVATVATAEVTTEDNTLELTVEPDQPVDLEIASVVAAPQFVVTLRNNSSIPLVGAVTISVRESRPNERLLARIDDASLNVARGGTQEFRIPAIVGADLTRIQVLIQSTAINDADLGNDVYPR